MATSAAAATRPPAGQALASGPVFPLHGSASQPYNCLSSRSGWLQPCESVSPGLRKPQRAPHPKH
eukprot:16430965-Heterocapsa_arctica.AAC.1